MTSYFCGENKELWGFSITYEGQFKDEVGNVNASIVKKIIDFSLEENMEMHVLPYISTPCIIIKTSDSIWYYLRSEQEANIFREKARVSDHYACCQFL